MSRLWLAALGTLSPMRDHGPVTHGCIKSLNVGPATPTTHSKVGTTGIVKHPTTEVVQVHAPGPRGIGGSGLAGDAVCDLKNHGGDHQAVYAYAREDLDWWEHELDRPLRDGQFGENLTTTGLDLTRMIVGSVCRVGAGGLMLQVTSPRIPCNTFAGHLGEPGWVRRFSEHGATGAYFMVLQPGPLQAGDDIEVISTPEHGISLQYMFRAVTTESHRLPELEVLDPMHPTTRKRLDAYRAAALVTAPAQPDAV